MKNPRPGELVIDRWFAWWGQGTVTRVLNSRVYVNFAGCGLVVYDRAHLQFLERSKP